MRQETIRTPECPVHRGSLVRRYRTLGPSGPGVYLQCVPRGGDQPHLLARLEIPLAAMSEPDPSALTPTERDVLADAADGLTVAETAIKRCKGTETVKSQRRSILLKLGARNTAQAVAMTLRERMLVLQQNPSAAA